MKRALLFAAVGLALGAGSAGAATPANPLPGLVVPKAQLRVQSVAGAYVVARTATYDVEVAATVKAVIAEMGSPTMKDMGNVMKATMAKFGGARVDGKIVSETVKRELAGK